ncbi:MAG: hypothetical protein IKH93_05735 [Bacteroidales bacterium]|nr:hypothetical protein [Bacteroidales bacterium]
MKKILSIALLLVSFNTLFAQEAEREVKTGWSFGVLPTATFSTDNGFQFGAFGDVYYYGDGDTYPDPLHKISWEASHFTKGRTRLYLAYDSKYLIPDMRVNASLTYVDDPMYNFWGFNGTPALQNYNLWGNKKDYTPGINYYGMSRKMFRGLANVQGRLADNLNWAAGINFWKWELGDMRESSKNENRYSTDVTLYRRYQEIGAITAEEANGGTSLELNAGLVFDTRDIEAAPNKGIWAEAYLNGNVINQRYLKACAYFRHYIDIPIHIKAGDPVFAYRLAWQQTIAGETPFYMIQNVPLLVQRNMISEGFGSSNTIRGIRENRILAEGFAWMNAELRVKLVKFNLFNQYFYIAINPFFDAGIVTKQYRPDVFGTGKTLDPRLALLGVDPVIYDAAKAGDIVYSGGAGLKIAMNQNFIVSVELAHCFYNEMVADPWIGIGINYQF